MMKIKAVNLVYFVGLFALLGNHSMIAQNTTSKTDKNETIAQRTSKEFVTKLLKKRNVADLTNTMFVNDFTSHFTSETEFFPDSLYNELTKKERERFFATEFNLFYLRAVDTYLKPNEEKNKSLEKTFWSAYAVVLPIELAKRIEAVVVSKNKKPLQFTNVTDFRERIQLIENVLNESREYLAKMNFEQSPSFVKQFEDSVYDDAINYRVRKYVGGANIKDCEPLIGFPENQVFYRVETPLYMGVVFVKVGKHMKIVRLTVVDDD
jgi:hypothetical protein